MLKLTPLNKYCTLATPNRLEIWKCNTLIIDHGDYLSLIDGNLNSSELDNLRTLFEKPVATCYSTHTHVDHVNNLHFLESRGIEIFSPELEIKYLLNIDLLLKDGGAEEQSARLEMRDFITGDLGFRNLSKAQGFSPEAVFTDNGIKLKSIPLPGHSPGHTGYLISTPGEPDILFVTDIGLDDFGAWYGFDYCDLSDYRNSITRLKEIYDPTRQILLSSHNSPNSPGNPGDFDRILDGIAKTETKILQVLSQSSNGRTTSEMTFTGLFYPLRSLRRMQGGLRKLYYFWEFYCIQNHLEELQKKKKVAADKEGRWFLNPLAPD